MKKHKHILLIIFGITILILTILSLFANTIIEYKLKKYIANDLPKNMEVSYKDINVNFFSGTLTSNNLQVIIKDTESKTTTSKFYLDTFRVENIGIWNYLFNKNVTIDNVLLDELKVAHYYFKKNEEKKTPPKKNIKVIPITIGNINFKNAKVTIYENHKDTVLFSSDRINFSIKNIFYSKETSSLKIPVKYDDFELDADNIYIKAGDYNLISINKLTKKDKFLSINDIHFKTKYSKKMYSKIIPFEKDHYRVSADSIIFDNFDFGITGSNFFLNTNSLDIKKAVGYIYRDKLVKDDVTLKNMFSKSIRNLPMSLTIDTISVYDSEIYYSEKTINKNKEGVLKIGIDKATISNLSNTYKTPEKTTVIVDGTFLRKTPYHVNWTFDVNNKKEEFIFNGNLGKFYGYEINSFITPLTNVRLNGAIDHTIFKIIGNDNNSMIYMSQKYTDIKIEILKKNKRKNKFISGIANIIIHNNSRSKAGEYNNVATDAKRDHTKAFFNYLVVNLKEAFLASFIKKKG